MLACDNDDPMVEVDVKAFVVDGLLGDAHLYRPADVQWNMVSFLVFIACPVWVPNCAPKSNGVAHNAGIYADPSQE